MQVIKNCGHMVHEDVPDKVRLFFILVGCDNYVISKRRF